MRTPRSNSHDEVLSVTGEHLTMPLYGLGPGFTGQRLLLMWNGLTGEGPTGPDNPLWQVGLTHGTARDQVTVVVITDAKLPAIPRHLGGPGEPTGIKFVAQTAQLCMIGILSAHFPGEVEALQAGTSKCREYSERIAEAPWTSVTANVDGGPVRFRLRRLRAGWAAVADVGDVAIGVAGFGCDITSHPIQRVSLDDYTP